METAVSGLAMADVFAQRKTSRGFSQTVFMFYWGVEQRRVDKITVYKWPTLLGIKTSATGRPFTPGLNKPSQCRHVNTPGQLPSLLRCPPPPHPPPPCHTASRDSELFVQGREAQQGVFALQGSPPLLPLGLLFFPCCFSPKLVQWFPDFSLYWSCRMEWLKLGEQNLYSQDFIIYHKFFCFNHIQFDWGAERV